MKLALADGLIQRAKELEKEALGAVGQLATVRACEAFRAKYLGRRRGAVEALLEELKQLPAEARREAGQTINALKVKLESGLQARIADLAQTESAQRLQAEAIDITLPGRTRRLGHLHLITQVTKEIEEIFMRLGFDVVSGPEIETDYYNFEALNIPKHHPARDDWDSFYIQGFADLLLRTHTSPVQIRVMEKQRPPVRVICPGKCFRRDASDATHSPVFHQIEMLWVDRGLSLAHLKGVIAIFVDEFFGKGFDIRFKGDYFPFTEPSIEIGIRRRDQQTPGTHRGGWLEIMGAGMVDPAVLAEVDYDPEVYSGFAFGLGVERMAMLKYGIDDIREFYRNDVRFLESF